jgi:hypothetical protein
MTGQGMAWHANMRTLSAHLQNVVKSAQSKVIYIASLYDLSCNHYQPSTLWLLLQVATTVAIRD